MEGRGGIFRTTPVKPKITVLEAMRYCKDQAKIEWLSHVLLCIGVIKRVSVL